MEQNKEKTLRIVIIVLAVALVLSVAALAGTLVYRYITNKARTTVTLPDNIIDSEPEETTLPTDDDGVDNTDTTDDKNNAASFEAASAEETENIVSQTTAATAGQTGTDAEVFSLYDKNPGDNEPFYVTNMLPGDFNTKYYCVRVSHNSGVTLHFRTSVRDGGEKLAEVLCCRVALLSDDEILYDGLMAEMPESLDHAVTGEGVTDTYYEINVYLDTSVGNDYQNRQLVADFYWWVEETDSLGPSPKTGDDMQIWLWAGIAGTCLICILILLAKRRKKEDEENG